MTCYSQKPSRRRKPESSGAATTRIHKHHLAKRTGAAAVEFAVVAPLMILLTFGLIELGRLSMLKETAVHASREAARVGMKPFSFESDATVRGEEELDLFGVSDGTVNVMFLNDGLNGEESVHVEVTIPLAGNTWIPDAITSTISSVSGQTVMRRESTR